ncbi:MAG: peptidoglycan editing factor PgeF [Mariprofundus sp.]|nr:peptidoglycan editing factor PgeF [Mariprofundus sp.]
MADPAFIHSKILSNHGFNGIFTLRHGGISPAPFDKQNFGSGLGDSDNNIEHNLHRLIIAAALPSIPHQAIQVHQTDRLWCSGQGHMHQQHADILMSNQPNTAIAVRVADCLPVLLADPKTGMIAAVHAGWRGTVAGIVKHAIQSMLEYGAKRKNLLASLGPCIGPCCFAIDNETATALKESTAGAANCIFHTPEIHADLQEINRLQLIESGITGVHIETIRACTACDPERFFSFRRDGKNSGRHLAIVATPPST